MDKLARMEAKLHHKLLLLGFDIRAYDKDRLLARLKSEQPSDHEKSSRATATAFLDKFHPVKLEEEDVSKRQKLMHPGTATLSSSDVKELEEVDDLMTDQDGPSILLPADLEPDKLRMFAALSDKMDIDKAACTIDTGCETRDGWRIRGEIVHTLKTYQMDAILHVLSRFERNSGAVIAHGCGLGKTLTTLAAIKVASEAGERIGKTVCAIIIVPKAVLLQWVCEEERWHDVLQLEVHPLFDCKHRLLANMVNAWRKHGGVAVCSHSKFTEESYSIVRDAITPETIVVLDEAHKCKNHKTELYKRLFALCSKKRILLTGTPMQNQLTEYFHILNLAKDKGIANNQAEFKTLFVNDIEQGMFKDASKEDREKSAHKMRVLQASARTLMHDKSSQELTTLLPPKYEFRISHEAPRQTIYGKGGVVQRIEYLNVVRTVKVELCLALVQSIHAAKPDDRILIFSDSNETLACVEQTLPAEKRAGMYTCKANDAAREVMLERLSSTAGAVLLIGTQAGGVGLQLEMANRVIMLDASWNPMNETQAIARSYRLGQTKEVFVYRLVGKDTIEDRIYRVGFVKKLVSAWLLDEESTKNPYTKEQIDTFGVDNEEQHPMHMKELARRDSILSTVAKDEKLIVYDHDALQEELFVPTQEELDKVENDLNRNILDRFCAEDERLFDDDGEFTRPYAPVISLRKNEKAQNDVRVPRSCSIDAAKSGYNFYAVCGCVQFSDSIFNDRNLDKESVVLQIEIQSGAGDFQTVSEFRFARMRYRRNESIPVFLSDATWLPDVPMRAYARYCKMLHSNVVHKGPRSEPSAAFQLSP
jgi:superfamily II DNA or RNA helicase